MTILTSLLLLFSFAHAEIEVSTCWSGTSIAEQNRNKLACEKSKEKFSFCSTNLWDHGRGLYDVCVLKSSGEKREIAHYRGFSESDAKKNLEACEKARLNYQYCEANGWAHGKGIYDVVLIGFEREKRLEPAEEKEKREKAAENILNKGKKKRLLYRSYYGRCYPESVEGEAFGTAVDDKFCSSGFLSDGNYCYNIDRYGERYGSRTDDKNCHVSYVVYFDRCYHADKDGKVYGSQVEDHFCQAYTEEDSGAESDKGTSVK